MRSHGPLLIALGACLVGPVTAVAQSQEKIGILRGAEAPAVTIQDLDGEPVDLGEYLGTKPVLIEFWAKWCENCEALLPKMHEAYGRFGDRVEFIAIGVGVGQSPRSIRRYLRKHPSPYRYSFDAKGAAVRAYRAPTTSYVVIVGSDGQVKYTGVGGDQDIVAAVREVLSLEGETD